MLTEIQKLENSNFDVMMGNYDFVLATHRFRTLETLVCEILCSVRNLMIRNLPTYCNRMSKSQVLAERCYG